MDNKENKINYWKTAAVILLIFFILTIISKEGVTIPLYILAGAIVAYIVFEFIKYLQLKEGQPDFNKTVEWIIKERAKHGEHLPLDQHWYSRKVGKYAYAYMCIRDNKPIVSFTVYLKGLRKHLVERDFRHVSQIDYDLDKSKRTEAISEIFGISEDDLV